MEMTPDHMNLAQKALSGGVGLGQFLRDLPEMPITELQVYSDAYVLLRGQKCGCNRCMDCVNAGDIQLKNALL